MFYDFRMSEFPLTTIKPNPKRTTAFTSLLMGVFIHNNLISSISGLSNLTETEAYRRYGTPFLRSLDIFSEYGTLEQVYVIDRLER